MAPNMQRDTRTEPEVTNTTVITLVFLSRCPSKEALMLIRFQGDTDANNAFLF